MCRRAPRPSGAAAVAPERATRAPGPTSVRSETSATAAGLEPGAGISRGSHPGRIGSPRRAISAESSRKWSDGCSTMCRSMYWKAKGDRGAESVPHRGHRRARSHPDGQVHAHARPDRLRRAAGVVAPRGEPRGEVGHPVDLEVPRECRRPGRSPRRRRRGRGASSPASRGGHDLVNVRRRRARAGSAAQQVEKSARARRTPPAALGDEAGQLVVEGAGAELDQRTSRRGEHAPARKRRTARATPRGELVPAKRSLWGSSAGRASSGGTSQAALPVPTGGSRAARGMGSHPIGHRAAAGDVKGRMERHVLSKSAACSAAARRPPR